MPFFLGFISVSSVRPTSSKFSSSFVGGGFSKLLERMPEDVMREKRESRDVRDGVASGWWIGERAEMSWISQLVLDVVEVDIAVPVVWHEGRERDVRMSGGRSRKIPEILKKAHSRRLNRGDYLMIAKDPGIGARSFVSLVARAERC